MNSEQYAKQHTRIRIPGKNGMLLGFWNYRKFQKWKRAHKRRAEAARCNWSPAKGGTA
jgi:hypothetical protein